MSILNYLFIGAGFTFLIDLLLGMKRIQNQPNVKHVLKDWGLKERIVCILIWPLAAIVFMISFFKTYFKK